MIPDTPDPIDLSAEELESLARVYRAHEIDNVDLIARLWQIAERYPRLVHVRELPDSDLHLRVEAGLGVDGRSLVNAFMVGQMHAFAQVRAYMQSKARKNEQLKGGAG